MLKKLETLIEDSYDYGEDSCELVLDGEQLLRFIEEAGMLPPKSPEYHNDKHAIYLGYESAKDYLCETGDTIELFEWEDEDE